MVSTDSGINKHLQTFLKMAGSVVGGGVDAATGGGLGTAASLITSPGSVTILAAVVGAGAAVGGAAGAVVGASTAFAMLSNIDKNRIK